MPVVQPIEYELGDWASFSPQSADSEWLTLTAPDGTVIKINAPTAVVRQHLEQVGEWRYHWADDDEGAVTVHLASEPAEPMGLID